MTYQFDGTNNLNNVGTTLAMGINSGTAAPTTLTVAAGTASAFAGATFPILLVLADQAETDTSRIEILRVTAPSGDVFPVTDRALFNTTAQTWNIGSKLEFRPVGEFWTEAQNAINDMAQTAPGASAFSYLNLSEQFHTRN